MSQGLNVTVVSRKVFLMFELESSFFKVSKYEDADATDNYVTSNQ